MSYYYSVMQICKEFYKIPLLVGNCLGKTLFTAVPGSREPAVGPIHSCSGTFRTTALSLRLLEASYPVLPGSGSLKLRPLKGVVLPGWGRGQTENRGVELPFPVWSHPIREGRSRDQRAVSPSLMPIPPLSVPGGMSYSLSGSKALILVRFASK